MKCKRQYIICGHYGSGKSNIAVNMAFDLKEKSIKENAAVKVGVLDIDIVNPYFRSVDSREELEAAGIEVICSEFANTNLDAPALPQEMYRIIDDTELVSVIDVGGDDRGAYALGRLRPGILKENNYEMIMVINKYRPLTRDVESTMEVLKEIEAACGIGFTGIINNSNLGADTTPETVIDSMAYANEMAKASGLKLIATTVDENIFNQLDGKIENLIPMKLQKRPV